MSTSFTPSNNRRTQQNNIFTYNFDKTSKSSVLYNSRIKSAKLKYPSFKNNFFTKEKNKSNFNDFSKNNTDSNNNSFKNHSTQIKKRPIWKYSYYVDKNDILNINNDSEIRNLLNNYRDIDNKPKPITYSWTKPRMIRIIENNKIIEEEIKSTFWKYSYLFRNDFVKPPGRLLKLLVNQLTSGYGNEYAYMRRNNYDDNNLRNKLFHDKNWRHPGVFKKNDYEPIKIRKVK